MRCARVLVGLTALVAQLLVAPPGRAEPANNHLLILSASCAACHGTNGNSVGGTPVLAGLDREYFLQQMNGFRDGSRGSTVMHHHAKGLSPEEITRLAEYFSAQPRARNAAPLPLGGPR